MPVSGEPAPVPVPCTMRAAAVGDSRKVKVVSPGVVDATSETEVAVSTTPNVDLGSAEPGDAVSRFCQVPSVARTNDLGPTNSTSVVPDDAPPTIRWTTFGAWNCPVTWDDDGPTATVLAKLKSAAPANVWAAERSAVVAGDTAAVDCSATGVEVAALLAHAPVARASAASPTTVRHRTGDNRHHGAPEGSTVASPDG